MKTILAFLFAGTFIVNAQHVVIVTNMATMKALQQLVSSRQISHGKTNVGNVPIYRKVLTNNTPRKMYFPQRLWGMNTNFVHAGTTFYPGSDVGVDDRPKDGFFYAPIGERDIWQRRLIKEQYQAEIRRYKQMYRPRRYHHYHDYRSGYYGGRYTRDLRNHIMSAGFYTHY